MAIFFQNFLDTKENTDHNRIVTIEYQRLTSSPAAHTQKGLYGIALGSTALVSSYMSLPTT